MFHSTRQSAIDLGLDLDPKLFEQPVRDKLALEDVSSCALDLLPQQYSSNG